MQKLAAVEEARRVMNEGKEWSIWRWLLEKGRVRGIADAGTAALDAAEKKVKAGWSDELKKACRELDAQAAFELNHRARHQYEKAREDIAPAIKAALQQVQEADVVAYNARMDAEAAFEEAERHLSGGMAREAAQKAIDAYDLREEAIRKAEAAARQAARGPRRPAAGRRARPADARRGRADRVEP